MSEKSLLLVGLIGLVKSVAKGLGIILIAAVALCAFVFALHSCMYLAAYYSGLTLRSDYLFPDWTFIPAHVVAAVSLLAASHFWRIPGALRKHGEAILHAAEQDRRRSEARRRLAERGAYLDPNRNVSRS